MVNKGEDPIWKLYLALIACRDVTKGAMGAQFPGRRIIMGAPNNCERRRKVPTMSQVLSSMQYIFFRKTCFE